LTWSFALASAPEAHRIIFFGGCTQRIGAATRITSILLDDLHIAANYPRF